MVAVSDKDAPFHQHGAANRWQLHQIKTPFHSPMYNACTSREPRVNLPPQKAGNAGHRYGNLYRHGWGHQVAASSGQHPIPFPMHVLRGFTRPKAGHVGHMHGTWNRPHSSGVCLHRFALPQHARICCGQSANHALISSPDPPIQVCRVMYV